jgi:hypothetical protein
LARLFHLFLGERIKVGEERVIGRNAARKLRFFPAIAHAFSPAHRGEELVKVGSSLLIEKCFEGVTQQRIANAFPELLRFT